MSNRNIAKIDLNNVALNKYKVTSTIKNVGKIIKSTG